MFFATNYNGSKMVPMCESSQKGWVFVKPQVQYLYFLPGYNFKLDYSDITYREKGMLGRVESSTSSPKE